MIFIRKEKVISQWCKRAAYGGGEGGRQSGGDSPLGERPVLGVKGSELHTYNGE